MNRREKDGPGQRGDAKVLEEGDQEQVAILGRPGFPRRNEAPNRAHEGRARADPSIGQATLRLLTIIKRLIVAEQASEGPSKAAIIGGEDGEFVEARAGWGVGVGDESGCNEEVRLGDSSGHSRRGEGERSRAGHPVVQLVEVRIRWAGRAAGRKANLNPHGP